MTDIDKAWKKEIFGYGSECYFNSINNFHYLLSLLLHIHRQQALDPTKDIEYFNDLYDLECIKKTFRCHGFNINKALAVFGMAENIPYPHSPDVHVPLGFASTSSSDFVCSNSTFTYIPIPIIPEAIVTWSRDAVAGISNPSATGTGGISETLINTTTETVTTYYIITITNGIDTYTETIDVCVNPIPTVTSSLGPISIWFGGDTVTYTPTSDVIGATFEWNRPTIQCVAETGTSGTGNISEYITVQPRCNVIYNVRACYNGCCGEWVEVVFRTRDA